MVVLSNADALLVAVPMIGTLVVCFFRLDELVGKPKKQAVAGHAPTGHRLSGTDAEGCVVLLDPDGTPQRISRRPARR